MIDADVDGVAAAEVISDVGVEEGVASMIDADVVGVAAAEVISGVGVEEGVASMIDANVGGVAAAKVVPCVGVDREVWVASVADAHAGTLGKPTLPAILYESVVQTPTLCMTRCPRLLRERRWLILVVSHKPSFSIRVPSPPPSSISAGSVLEAVSLEQEGSSSSAGAMGSRSRPSPPWSASVPPPRYRDRNRTAS